MSLIKRLTPALAILACAAGAIAPAAHASTTQQSIIEDDVQLHDNPAAALATMHDLGATLVKVAVYWNSIAPKPTSSHAPAFKATDPGAYPAANWAYYDNIDRLATADGMKVAFMVTSPAPLWATGPDPAPGCTKPCGQWKPNAAEFGAFVQAVGERYDGTYTPAGASSALPRVNWWSIWNEPNYGPNLAPQAIDGNTVDSAAIMYRALVDAAWRGLAATGHTPASDTILIGETAPRGRYGPGFPGNYSGTMPVIFVQSLYCLNARNQRFTGRIAAENGCTASASAFKRANPGLFQASGFADHPYAQGTPPTIPTYACGNTFCTNTRTKKSDPYYADFAELPRFEKLLDKAQAVYGSGKRFPVWNTEYGYWTNPPDSALPPAYKRQAVPPATAAYYMNWAEYLSYESPRIASYAQYLLVDPASGAFADGLVLANGMPLPTFDAYAMPLYLPVTNAAHAASLIVWGGLRAAPYALSASGFAQQAQIQFSPGSSADFTTVRTVTITNRLGYFDVKQPFTQSGQVRIAWTTPGGQTTYSRTQAITVG